MASQKRALAEKAAQKRLMAIIPSVRNLRRTNARIIVDPGSKADEATIGSPGEVEATRVGGAETQ